MPWDFPAWRMFFDESEESDEIDPYSVPVIRLIMDDTESKEVIAAQVAALEYMKANEEKVKEAILEGLLPVYQKWYSHAQKEFGDTFMFDPDGDTPELDSIDGLEKVFSFQGMTLTMEVDDGMARVGYAFSSEVEDEHGVGVVVSRDKVLGIGYQEICETGDAEFYFTDEFFESCCDGFDDDDDSFDDDDDDDDDE